jgi:hypothetical protein
MPHNASMGSKCLLWYHGVAIGYAKPSGNIDVKHGVMRQEVDDMLRKNNLSDDVQWTMT